MCRFPVITTGGNYEKCAFFWEQNKNLDLVFGKKNAKQTKFEAFFTFLPNVLFSFLESDPFFQRNHGKMCFCLRTSNKYCADSCQLIGAPLVSHVIITAAAAFIIHLWRIAATNDAC